MWEMRSVGAVRCGVKYVTEICAQLRERLERGACHGGLGFVDLRSGVNVRICNLRCKRKG